MERDDDIWGLEDQVVQASLDPGGFVPRRCCLCGGLLVPSFAAYREGPLCRTCDAAVQFRLRGTTQGQATAEAGEVVGGVACRDAGRSAGSAGLKGGR